MLRRQSGFTLIEIAIVLVIIGLLLGGVLKGQELITSARVRNLISQQDGIKAAFFGFQDRFRALPGDYNRASTTINCTPACTDGNGNGRIENIADGATIDEQNAVWEHLSKSGFINGSYTYAAGTPNVNTSPSNPYSAFVDLHYDSIYGDPAAAGYATQPKKHNLKSGNQIPVEILSEVDRKVDDGDPFRGAFMFAAQGTATVANCAVNANPNTWKTTGTTSVDCAGTSIF
jgi:prepilin-type N-terminal cleavage/methylation domain-containing protein